MNPCFSLVIKIFIICCSSICFSQNQGYFGHRNYFQFDIITGYPLLHENGGYVRDGNSLMEGKPTRARLEAHLSASHILNENVSLGIEIGYGTWNISGTEVYFGEFHPKYGALSSFPYYTDYLAIENVRVNRLLFIPKIELARKSEFLPVGLNYTFGAGVSCMNFYEKDYIVAMVTGWGIKEAPDSLLLNSREFIDFDKNLFGIHMFAGANVRLPLAEHLIINIGLRYKFDIKLYSTFGYNAMDRLKRSAAVATGLNFMALNTGLIFSF